MVNFCRMASAFSTTFWTSPFEIFFDPFYSLQHLQKV